ncbi:hypothetical protein BJ742DRAFT_684927, partial [Cladochytrium replicatum]
RVFVIANEQGHRTIPAFVAFNDQGRLFGEAATEQAHVNPSNTILHGASL